MLNVHVPRVTLRRLPIIEGIDKAGTTQDTFAKKLGIDPSLFSKMLRGRRDTDLFTVFRIAFLLDLDWAEIIAEECRACGQPVQAVKGKADAEQAA